MSTDEGLYGQLPVGFHNLPEGKQVAKKVVVKLHLKKDATYKTFAITNTTTTAELLALYAKKIGLTAALGESLQLLQVDDKGGERALDAHDRPGGLQLKWQEQQPPPHQLPKLVVTFSEASKESMRLSVKQRRSSTADALELALGLPAASSSSSVADDLAALDAIAADFAVPLSQREVSAAAAVAKKPVVVPHNAKTTPGGKTRLKIVPVAEDAEFQGLLAALKSPNRAAAAATAAPAAASAAADDFDRIVGDLGDGAGGKAASASADLVALEEFGIRDDDFNVVVAESSSAATIRAAKTAQQDSAFAEIDGALSFALSGLDDIVVTSTRQEAGGGDGGDVDIDFDAMLAQLSQLSKDT